MHNTRSSILIILAMSGIVVAIVTGCTKQDEAKHFMMSSTNTNHQYGDMMMTGNTEKDMEMINEMMVANLGQNDPNYEDHFIDMMIPHHEGAVMMAKNALKNANKPEIKKMAENIIIAQEKEIAQLKEWRMQWYGH